MRCPQPEARPELPSWLLEAYPDAVTRKARVTHYCEGRVTRCILEIAPGDYCVAPGILFYGVQVVWCLDCAGVRIEPKVRRRINKRRIRS